VSAQGGPASAGPGIREGQDALLQDLRKQVELESIAELRLGGCSAIPPFRLFSDSAGQNQALLTLTYEGGVCRANWGERVTSLASENRPAFAGADAPRPPPLLCQPSAVTPGRTPHWRPRAP
jgi:hypothetical protein